MSVRDGKSASAMIDLAVANGWSVDQQWTSDGLAVAGALVFTKTLPGETAGRRISVRFNKDGRVRDASYGRLGLRGSIKISAVMAREELSN